MEIKTYKADIGVIIARFQTPTLSEAHKDLIDTVKSKHKRLIIVLGLSPCKTTKNNPLDFEARKQLILESYPEATVLYIKDVNNDELWSKKLDEIINDIAGPGQKAILYGGRESFIPFYKGEYHTQELESNRFISGTELRKEAGIKSKPSADFRAGVIWATMNKWPAAIPTVDLAIYDKANKKVLLARKPDEKKYRFVGGFATPNSKSYEEDAKREGFEETGLVVDDVDYIGSSYINDWRYAAESDRIKTIFFIGYYNFGRPVANDDVAEVKWYNITDDLDNLIVDTHKPLLEMFRKYLSKLT